MVDGVGVALSLSVKRAASHFGQSALVSQIRCQHEPAIEGAVTFGSISFVFL